MTHASSHPVISLKNIQKNFYLGKNEVRALIDISLDITPGEYVILYGPSGCGKSTLLNVIAGLEVPTKGRVSIRGDDLSRLSTNALARHRRDKIGIVFQQFNLLRSMNIVSNVALPELFRGEKRSTRLHRAKMLLSELGLEKYHRHKPPELSGGQQQRVAIARALVNNPWIILADEPTGNVDSKTAEEIMRIFWDLNRKSKRTILLVTHNADYLHYADRVLYMRDGMIVKEDRQERSLQELAEIRLDREVGHWVREYHRKDLDAKAQELGLNPKDYHSESLIARTILIKSGFLKKILEEHEAAQKAGESVQPPVATVAAVPDEDREKMARKMARELHRSELDTKAVALGLDPKSYRHEEEIARAIIDKQHEGEHHENR